MKKTKRIMKKLIVSLMALFMLVGTTLSVQADPTIGTTDKGSLKITKKTDEGENLAGAEFTLYKIMNLTPATAGTETVPGTYASYSVVEGYETALEDVTPDILGSYSAAQIESKTNALLAAIEADKTGAQKITGIVMDKTDTDGVSTAADLALGYYMVVETTTPEGYVAGKPFFIAIPSTNNYSDGTTSTAGTTWNYNLEIEPKNTKVPLTKKIIKEQDEDGNDVLVGKDTTGVGSNVKFVVDTKVPNFTEEYFADGKAPVFELNDTMSAGLTFKDDVKVYIITVDGDDKEVKTEVKAVDGEDTNWTKSAVTDRGFKISFSKEFLYDNRNADIRLYYSADINDDAVMGTDPEVAGNDNKVVLTYSNNPQNVTKTETKDDDTKLYTFGIKVEKYAMVNNVATNLGGAKFALYTDSACTQQVQTDKTTADGVGVVSFEKVDAGIYYLKEIESPSGYKLLIKPIEIEVRALNGADNEPNGQYELYVNGTKITVDETDDEVDSTLISRYNLTSGISTVPVENQKGFTLPETGGMGVVIFLVIGIVGLSVLSIMMMKKKKTYQS